MKDGDESGEGGRRPCGPPVTRVISSLRLIRDTAAVETARSEPAPPRAVCARNERPGPGVGLG